MPATILIPIEATRNRTTDKDGKTNRPQPKTGRASLLEPALRMAQSA